MILAFSPVGDGLTGTLTMPSWKTADGVIFTDVHGPVSARPASVAVIDGDRLRLIVRDPKNPAEPDAMVVSRKGDDQVNVIYEDAPLPPWVFTRTAADTHVATDWDMRVTYAIARPPVPRNEEMKKIYDEDQRDRQEMSKKGDVDWQRVSARDADRRRRTRALLDANGLDAGEDFRNAAFVFQHGGSPNDFLTAHALALVALAKGDSQAAWIAAATMDRYLGSIGKPAIYGTRFVERKDGTMVEAEPFDRAVLSDVLRRGLGVRPVKEWAEEYKAALAGQ
jgi:hypothetical protein